MMVTADMVKVTRMVRRIITARKGKSKEDLVECETGDQRAELDIAGRRKRARAAIPELELLEAVSEVNSGDIENIEDKDVFTSGKESVMNIREAIIMLCWVLMAL